MRWYFQFLTGLDLLILNGLSLRMLGCERLESVVQVPRIVYSRLEGF